MTMVFHIFEGLRSIIEAPIQIFTNKNNNYSIHGLDDFVSRVSYHIGPKGWMDQSLFFQYFIKPCAHHLDIHHHTKYIWIDNCTAHNIIPTSTPILIL